VTGNEVRRSFLDFFAARGHTILPSVPLVLPNDPSLLFVNAGMVPFKQVFLGVETRPYRRAANSQKCLRISGKHNDLEEVGRDTHHHTFFEMLGNWSFGDYYKREAIGWAWELLADVWKLPVDRLWASVYTTDDEAAALWRELTPLPPERILRFENENFWEMGDTGPCGPCSEVHYDRGPAACDRSGVPHVCRVNGECARFIEIWNLVFIQHHRDAAGVLSDLPSKHVDTGMGFERICAVLQGVSGNYDIDVFREIIGTAAGLAGVRYGATPATDVSLRVIADHARAVTFLIADGVLPSNESRGYVLRRLLRRAARHGKLLGLAGPFLHEVVGGVVRAMGEAYPELVADHARLAEVVRTEEERFAATLDRGLALLEEEIAAAKARGERVLPGEAAFRLYDTFGFPLDLTEDILKADAFTVDRTGFERAMDAQRTRARGAQRFVAAAADLGGVPDVETRFVGDRLAECESEILGLLVDGAPATGRAGADARVVIVTPETPFYAEGGGQVGDRGWIDTVEGGRVEVEDTKRIGRGAVAHHGVVRAGTVGVGDRVRLHIDVAHRARTRLNHSATHLMHAALRHRLGTHVQQAGSLVAPDRLRFDFSHHQAVSDAELDAIETEVNEEIRANLDVTSEEMAYDDAIAAGALAFFGDKYGDTVRVVRMGDYSVELCGGTHVSRTGDIGVFKVRSESGVAAGVRRIEAQTGAGALEAIREHEQTLRTIGALLKGAEHEAPARLEKLLAQQKDLERRIGELQAKLAGGQAHDVMRDARDVGGMTVLATRVDGLDDKGLRELADRLRDRVGSGVVVVGAEREGRALLLAAVTKDLVGRVHAGNLIKALAPIVGGGGGGRPDFAQAGGKDPSRLDEALAAAYEHVGAEQAAS
jgi:alanyl-tRNA synthetase